MFLARLLAWESTVMPLALTVNLLVVFNERVYDFENFDYLDNKMALQQELEALFDRKVDLVAQEALRNPYFIRYLEQTKQLIYAA